MLPLTFSVIVTATQSGVIGKDGMLPWPRIDADIKHAQSITSTIIEDTDSQHANVKNVVIMGLHTWRSIPACDTQLGRRIIIIITEHHIDELIATTTGHEDIYVMNSLSSSLEFLANTQIKHDKVFVIGGSRLYQEALSSDSCVKVYLTRVLNEFEGDATIEALNCQRDWKIVEISDVMLDNGLAYQFQTLYRRMSLRRNHEEQQYLDLVKKVIEYGASKLDRTCVGTKSVFGAQMRFSLSGNMFPLLTTKRVFWRGVVEELLWLVRGCTDSSELSRKNVHIWDANGDRSFLDALGFTERKEGDLGPVYGHQWRHYGAEYHSSSTNYTGLGIDQLAQVIEKIKNNPNDRRIIMTAWNPVDLDNMSLPPCHVLSQFYVSNGELSCQMYQRSCDLGLGVPFNIASYSLLTIMIAHVCGLKPGEFIHSMGDAHVYTNHIAALREQITRTPRSFPKLEIVRDVPGIDQFRFEDFKLTDYTPMTSIKMDMAV